MLRTSLAGQWLRLHAPTAGDTGSIPGLGAKSSHASQVKSLSRVRLFATPWTVACQAPLSMGFSRQEYWNGLPFPSPGDFLDPGIESGSPALQADSLPSEPPGKPMPLKGNHSENLCKEFGPFCAFPSYPPTIPILHALRLNLNLY